LHRQQHPHDANGDATDDDPSSSSDDDPFGFNSHGSDGPEYVSPEDAFPAFAGLPSGKACCSNSLTFLVTAIDRFLGVDGIRMTLLTSIPTADIENVEAMIAEQSSRRTSEAKFALETMATLPSISPQPCLSPASVHPGDEADIKEAIRRQKQYQIERTMRLAGVGTVNHSLFFTTDSTGNCTASLRIINPSATPEDRPLPKGTLPPPNIKTDHLPNISDTISLFNLDKEQQVPFAVLVDRCVPNRNNYLEFNLTRKQSEFFPSTHVVAIFPPSLSSALYPLSNACTG
jgi:hypothetical protein